MKLAYDRVHLHTSEQRNEPLGSIMESLDQLYSNQS